MPKTIRVNLPDDAGKFNFIAGVSGQNIMIICELSINQTIFPTTKYDEIKQFYEMIVAKMAEQIVLKKTI